MPETLINPNLAAGLQRAAIGFHGKIPARGDFVSAGLPRGFIDAWDRWMQRMLAAGRATLGQEWLPAWLQAPVWRFALAAEICGPAAVLGLWMPSIDRIGRHFPLTLAAVLPDTHPHRLLIDASGFLAAAEAAGREALANDLPPESLAALMVAAAAAPPTDPGVDISHYLSSGALWWTEGAPLVATGAFVGDALPDEATFVTMLDGRASKRS
jgi:type VI secretion system protein ImpM